MRYVFNFSVREENMDVIYVLIVIVLVFVFLYTYLMMFYKYVEKIVLNTDINQEEEQWGIFLSFYLQEY